MIDKVYEAIEEILNETIQFDFPIFVKEDKKKEIILEKKKYIEEKFKIINPILFNHEDKINEIWTESIDYANKQFEFLPIDKRINGFYLQELMHCYAEKLGTKTIIMLKEN